VRVGVISDTHGMLRPDVLKYFADVGHILHAGDIGDEDLLIALEAVAPVTAVWGNTDGLALRHRIPEIATVVLERRTIAVVHGHQLGSPTPEALRQAVVGVAPSGTRDIQAQPDGPSARGRARPQEAQDAGILGRRAYRDADIVVFGHTHRPTIEWLGGILYLNPGGAGAARFNLRPTIALLELAEPAVDVRLIDL
jgi:hypothetical protein